MTTPAAKVRLDGAILRIELDRPKANVLSMEMMGEIAAALDAHRDDAKLKLVTLRGTGSNFSFGASVPEHVKEKAPGMLAAFHRTIRAVAAFPVPVAALVEGRCLGGAFELALACHYLFAKESAVFACPEVKLGVVPPVLAVLGHHRLGAPLTELLVTTGAEISAAQADARGALTARVPAEADLDAFVTAWFDKHLAPLSAFALREATFAARSGAGIFASLGAPLDAAEARYVERLLPSHDGNEGITAFLEKRAPVWADR